MSYRVEIPQNIRERIAEWVASGCMPDVLLVDIYQHLQGDRLATNPSGCLRRTYSPFDGMVYEFEVVLPGSSSRHLFVFHMIYVREDTLRVVGGGYFPAHFV